MIPGENSKAASKRGLAAVRKVPIVMVDVSADVRFLSAVQEPLQFAYTVGGRQNRDDLKVTF